MPVSNFKNLQYEKPVRVPLTLCPYNESQLVQCCFRPRRQQNYSKCLILCRIKVRLGMTQGLV